MLGKSVAIRRTGRRDDPERLRRHRVEGVLRRTGAGPATQVPLDPFDDEAMAAALAWMAVGIEHGRDPTDLQAEIATRLWPWASRMCDRAIGRLPRHADGAEVRGRVATVLWQCCARLDPDQPPGWASWLHIRIRGAVADAARSDDPLSRRDRRSLVESGADGPAAGTGLRTVPLDEADPLPATGPDPCRAVLDDAMRDAVHRWMLDDLPSDLAERLIRWWQTTGATTSLPAALAEELRPYVFRLVPAAALLD